MEWPEYFIGQHAFRKRVVADLEVSSKTGKPFRFAFIGPAGTGKTTGAETIAKGRGMRFREVMPSDNLDSVMLEIDYDWKGVFPGILFPDEFHLFTRKNLGKLLPLTDHRMAYTTEGRRPVKLWFPNVSVIVATTEWSRTRPDIASRFSVYKFARLSSEDARTVMANFALREFSFSMPPELVKGLSSRLFGNGREATKFAKASYALHLSGGELSVPSVLFQLGLTPSGLSESAQEHLLAVWNVGKGHSVTRGVLAKELGVVPGEMANDEQELRGKGLIDIVNGVGQELTQEGRALAHSLTANSQHVQKS